MYIIELFTIFVTITDGEILTKAGTFQCFGRARKTNLVFLKKGRQNFKFFFEIRLPRENPRFAPDYYYSTVIIKLVYIAVQGVFEKMFCVGRQKWMS